MTVRERAGTVLGVSSDAPPSDVRAAFLNRIAAEEFLPADEAVWAASALGETQLPWSVEARAESADAERQAVDAFAKEYWSLPPSERRTRWDDLRQRSADPGVSSRLAEFELGLAVETKPHDNSLVEELGAAIRELYVLPRRESVLKRCEWLITNADRRADFRDAARRLRTDAWQLSRLVPLLLTELSWKEQFAPVTEIDRKFAEAEREEWARKRAAQAEAAAQQQASRFGYQQPQSNGGGCGGWSVYLVIALVMFGIRACNSANRNDSTTTPTIKWDQRQSPDYRFQATFTDAEIALFNEYEFENQFKRERISPPRHALWVLAGRPGWPPKNFEGRPGWPPPSLRGTRR